MSIETTRLLASVRRALSQRNDFAYFSISQFSVHVQGDPSFYWLRFLEFRRVTKVMCQFCHICSCPSRIGQPVEVVKSLSTKARAWSHGSPCTRSPLFVICRLTNRHICVWNSEYAPSWVARTEVTDPKLDGWASEHRSDSAILRTFEISRWIIYHRSRLRLSPCMACVYSVSDARSR